MVQIQKPGLDIFEEDASTVQSNDMERSMDDRKELSVQWVAHKVLKRGKETGG
jgi:hypothetical protein